MTGFARSSLTSRFHQAVREQHREIAAAIGGGRPRSLGPAHARAPRVPTPDLRNALGPGAARRAALGARRRRRSGAPTVSSSGRTPPLKRSQVLKAVAVELGDVEHPVCHSLPAELAQPPGDVLGRPPEARRHRHEPVVEPEPPWHARRAPGLAVGGVVGRAAASSMSALKRRSGPTSSGGICLPSTPPIVIQLVLTPRLRSIASSTVAAKVIVVCHQILTGSPGHGRPRRTPPRSCVARARGWRREAHEDDHAVGDLRRGPQHLGPAQAT